MTLQFDAMLSELQQQGYSVQENFIPAQLVQGLHENLIQLSQRQSLQPAGIGRAQHFQVEQTIRSDQIAWFDEVNLSVAQQDYLDLMEQLRSAVNERFFAGLFDFEAHFAVYAPRAFYQRHLDQHRDQDTRVLTVVTYLNHGWRFQDGGELRLYLDEQHHLDVLPQAGTLVCFFSADFEHEVLVSNRERYSLTGWFRKRPV